ncbi:hypothetical protein EJB05_21698, partial [Eragrostis curvula]
MGDSSRIVVVISDDEEDEPQVMAQGVEVEQDVESEIPDWLPDGWVMETYRTDDGTINTYYVSPVSQSAFTTKSEALEYIFSGADERLLQSRETAADFLRAHDWLPKGWVLEIRAGGSHMDKMYKFFLQPKTGVRLHSKEDVLLYIKEMKISTCVTNGDCDTSTNDNILAHVELNPDDLPKGWVKEDVFRKSTKRGFQKYLYYTDPVSHRTFRTLKSALHYATTGEIIDHRSCINQKTSIYDIYSFDKSADLHESLRTRLRIEVNAAQETGFSPI